MESIYAPNNAKEESNDFPPPPHFWIFKMERFWFLEIFDPNIDRSKKSKRGKLTKNVTNYMQMLKWKICVSLNLNPVLRDYTFLSDRQKTYISDFADKF